MASKRPAFFISLAASLLITPLAHAEGKISIAQQFGIGYLILDVVRDQQHGRPARVDLARWIGRHDLG